MITQIKDNMETLVYCIQCKDTKTDKIGSFMYSNTKPFEAISPVFNDLTELYAWLNANDYMVGLDISDPRIYRSEKWYRKHSLN